MSISLILYTFFAVLFLTGCNLEEQDNPASSEVTHKVDEDTNVTTSSDLDGKLVEVNTASELALEMRAIEKELKHIKQQLNQNKTTVSWVFEPENFLEAKATDPNVKNGDFTSYTHAFHQAGQDLKTNPTAEQYELVIQACVNCHEQFCTGPIKRIEKLHF